MFPSRSPLFLALSCPHFVLVSASLNYLFLFLSFPSHLSSAFSAAPFYSPPLHPSGWTAFIIFLINVSWRIIFFVAMWSVGQVAKALLSNSFLKIRLPIWELGHPLQACVCVCALYCIIISIHFCPCTVYFCICTILDLKKCLFVGTPTTWTQG